MTEEDKALVERAWQIYCEETKGSSATVDFWHEVPAAYQADLLNRIKEATKQ